MLELVTLRRLLCPFSLLLLRHRIHTFDVVTRYISEMATSTNAVPSETLRKYYFSYISVIILCHYSAPPLLHVKQGQCVVVYS